MRTRAIIAIAAALAVTSQALPSAAQTPSGTPRKFPVGVVSATAPEWPTLVAEEKGFFAKQGLAPEITYVGNVANTVQQLVGGSFGIAGSTFDTAVRAIAKGSDAVIIGGTAMKYPYSVMVAPEIKTVADLKGRQVMLPFQKDLTAVIWRRWVTEQGGKPADIEEVYDGATPNRFAALIAKRVQGALVTQPFDFRAKGQGYAKLMDLGDYAKDFGFLVIMSRPSWLKANPADARAYLQAVSDAVDWLYDPANRADAIALLAKASKLDPVFAEQTWEYYIKDLQPFSRKLAVTDAKLQGTVRTLIEIGDIKQSDVDGKTLVDPQFLPK